MTPHLGLYWSQYVINNIHIIKISTKVLKSIKLSHIQSCNKRKLQQTARAHALLLNLSKWFFALLDLYKTMTFLEKMIMDYNNGLHILPGLKKIVFFATNVLATWVKNLKLQKTDTRPLSYQKTDTKRNPWVAIY